MKNTLTTLLLILSIFSMAPGAFAAGDDSESAQNDPGKNAEKPVVISHGGEDSGPK